MANILHEYKNGNAQITLYADGTRIIRTEDDILNFEYPLNNDITITHKCDGGCPYCYLGCTENGKHADILSYKFFDTLLPGTECAINLNDMSHPQLLAFLGKMKNKGIVVNGTINQKHFMKYWKDLYMLTMQGLIHGVGVSLTAPNEELFKVLHYFPNAVVHVINGIVSEGDIMKMEGQGIKLLILGYKALRRGEAYLTANNDEVAKRQKFLYDYIAGEPKFKAISFDNLAIEQLDARRIVTDEQWEMMYQGEEGSATFAIDLVDGTFAVSSSETKTFPIMDDIQEMFKVVKAQCA